MKILKTLLRRCFSASRDDLVNERNNSSAEKLTSYTRFPSDTELQSAADETCDKVIQLISTTNAIDMPTLSLQIHEIVTSGRPITVSSSWWTKTVLTKLYVAMAWLVASVIELKQDLGPAMGKAYDEAESFADQLKSFQGEHPTLAVSIQTTAFALLIAVLTPSLFEALGFSTEGIVQGECIVLYVLDDHFANC
jgi:hypothetical protein